MFIKVITMYRILRNVGRMTPAAYIPLFDRTNKMDKNSIQEREVIPVTGFDAVQKMFKRGEMDEVSVELRTVIQTSITGAFFGAILGGFVKSKEAYLYFIENNQATIFTSTQQAKKKLQDFVTVAFCKGAYHWGWRLAFFMGTFSAISTTISVYRGDTSVLEYVAAGTITGGLYKANLGLRAVLVGAGLGAVLSAIAGVTIVCILAVTGFTMEDIRRVWYSVKVFREYHYNQALEKSATIKNDELTRHHDLMVEMAGEKKLDEI